MLVDPLTVLNQEIVDQVAIPLLKIVDQTKHAELNRMQKFQRLNIVNHYRKKFFPVMNSHGTRGGDDHPHDSRRPETLKKPLN
jgi:hypothetical protein